MKTSRDGLESMTSLSFAMQKGNTYSRPVPAWRRDRSYFPCGKTLAFLLGMTTKTWITVGCLAGAYKGNRQNLSVTLTHLMNADTQEAYCRKSLNVCPDGYTAEEEAAKPTCPKCATKWEKK